MSRFLVGLVVVACCVAFVNALGLDVEHYVALKSFYDAAGEPDFPLCVVSVDDCKSGCPPTHPDCPRILVGANCTGAAVTCNMNGKIVSMSAGVVDHSFGLNCSYIQSFAFPSKWWKHFGIGIGDAVDFDVFVRSNDTNSDNGAVLTITFRQFRSVVSSRITGTIPTEVSSLSQLTALCDRLGQTCPIDFDPPCLAIADISRTINCRERFQICRI